MKKGFTLVEIIISISLILFVGVSTTFFFVNKSSDKTIENVTNKILEAANLYAKTEKDTDGNIYSNKVLSGAKGVQIPLQNLVSKGYVDENLANEVYKYKGKPESDKDYYVMFLTDNNYCEEGSTVTISSWMDEGEEVYLCDYELPESSGSEPESKTLIETILDGATVETKENITKDDYYFTRVTRGSKCDPWYDYITITISKQNGLYKKNNTTYYYRGNVTNNYLSLNGQIFRIISFDTSKEILKVIKETAIDSTIYNNVTGSSEFSCAGNSRIRNALVKWVDDFKNDMNDKYFDSSLIIGLDEMSYGVSGDCIDWDVGLISKVEAEYAGVYPDVVGIHYYDIPTDFDSSTTGVAALVISQNWLSTGDSTIIAGGDYGISNYFRETNSSWLDSVDGTSGVFVTVDVNNINIASYIRPVIALNNSFSWVNYVVTGNGSKENPYTITFK